MFKRFMFVSIAMLMVASIMLDCMRTCSTSGRSTGC